MSDKSITTHILDTSVGLPAAGIPVRLCKRGPDDSWLTLAETRTDSDGRIRSFGPSSVEPGVHRLTFDVAEYFRGRNVESFYPVIEIIFEIGAGEGRDHYHVPLLVSPFGYSTYRGS